MPLAETARVLPDPLSVIREHARDRGDARAVQDSAGRLSYAELVDRIDRRARGLLAHGAVRGDRVGIHLGNSVDYVVTVLACLQAGVVFVPIPFSDPADRILRIARNCDLRLTVVPARWTGPEEVAAVLRPVELSALDQVAESVGGAAAVEEARVSPVDIVYFVYTSGSTGDPKGAMIRRESLGNLIRNTIDVFGLTPDTRALCVSPFHFDGAFGSLFSVLVAGGSLVIADHGVVPPWEFFRLLVSERVTHTSFSPTMLRLLVGSRDLSALAGSSLRTVGLGGEDWSRADVLPLFEHLPELKVFNRYGPTETTVVVATHLVDRQWCAQDRPIPLGRPDPGVEFHLVDAQGTIVTSPGTVGELYVGGIQVMAGYWNAPEVTEAVLRDDIVEGTRLYRTGDLLQLTEDGLYVYLDRADNVVKRNGNRVSMTEITAALLRIPGVRDAVSIVDGPRTRPTIHSYVVTSPVSTVQEVRTHLLRTVPAYMNPDRLVVLDALPRTSTGKPDVQRLRATH